MISRMSLSRRGKMLLFGSCTCMLINAFVATVTAYKMASILDYAQAMDWDRVIFTTGLTLFLLLLNFALSVSITVTRQRYLSDGDIRMRQAVMQNLLNRPSVFQRKKDSAYYMTLLTTDSDTYRAARMATIPFMWDAAVNILASTAMLLYLSPWLFVISLISTVVPIALQKQLACRQNEARNRFSESAHSYTHVLKECVDGSSAIRETKSAPYFADRFLSASKQMQKSNENFLILSNAGNQLLYTVASLVSWVGILVGAVLIMRGSFSAAKMLAATSCFSSFSNNVSNLIEHIVSYRSAAGITKRLHEETEYPVPADSNVEAVKAAELAYHHVSFGFDKKPLYSDFSYTFEPGRCYAIVGESGSGKSTLLKLMLKYYDNYSGSITINGQDIHDLDESRIFQQIGVVSQTPYLFNGSLYENITMFRDVPTSDSEEYQHLLEQLGISDLAALTGNAPLGDFGDKLSGGERQRVALARIMIQHKKTILFDEPTAALDPDNRDSINNFIFGLQGYTRIVITHDRREEYLRQFDDVLYMNRHE